MREVRRVIFDLFWIVLSGVGFIGGLALVWKIQIMRTISERAGDYLIGSVFSIGMFLFLFFSLNDLYGWWKGIPSLADKKGVREA